MPNSTEPKMIDLSMPPPASVVLAGIGGPRRMLTPDEAVELLVSEYDHDRAEAQSLVESFMADKPADHHINPMMVLYLSVDSSASGASPGSTR